MDRMKHMAALAVLATESLPSFEDTTKHAPIGKGRVVGYSPVKPGEVKPKRNDPCPGGCGQKVKRCACKS